MGKRLEALADSLEAKGNVADARPLSLHVDSLEPSHPHRPLRLPKDVFNHQLHVSPFGLGGLELLRHAPQSLLEALPPGCTGRLGFSLLHPLCEVGEGLLVGGQLGLSLGGPLLPSG